MAFQSSSHNLVISEPRPLTPRSRQVKPIKSHALLSAGIRRLKTLSGVSQNRACFEHHQPPVPPLSDATLESKGNWPATLAIPNLQLVESTGSEPPPPLSQLRGIHFLHDANLDPDLETDSRTSRSQSVLSRQSSAVSAPGTPLHLGDSDTWADERDGSISHPLTPSEDSSLTTTTDSSSLISRVLEVINSATGKLPQLSPRACQAAFPPIDLQSPYAPYAPTSPLSATSTQKSHSPPSAQSNPATFNIRMGLRSLPSVSTKSKAITPQHRATQEPSALQLNNGSGSSSNYVPSPSQGASSIGNLQDPLTGLLSSLSHEAGSDQCSKQKTLAFPSVSPHPTKSTPKAGGIKDKLGWAGKSRSSKHLRARSESTGRLATIPFPRSSYDDCEASPENQVDKSRNRSESSNSHFRHHLNSILTLPIQRIRTSSSLSTIIRSIKPGKSTVRRSPSETSFEATRPFSVRTESFYEILDASAIPPCNSNLIPT